MVGDGVDDEGIAPFVDPPRWLARILGPQRVMLDFPVNG